MPDDDPPAKTEKFSLGALELLNYFRNNRNKFVAFSAGLFENESRDKDSVTETIQENVGATNWTYEFVRNKKTGFIYVKQSQNGVQVTNYWVSKAPLERIILLEIKFKPYTIDYKDDNDVIKRLTPFAEFLKDNPAITIMITGNVRGFPPAVMATARQLWLRPLTPLSTANGKSGKYPR